jgi:hypothetical protein
VEANRARRRFEHAAAVAEVLAAPPGATLSNSAASVALALLLSAARRGAARGARTAAKDGLACTIFHTPGAVGCPAVAADTWTAWTPGRSVVFHAEGQAAAVPVGAEDDSEPAARLVVGGTR